jgi:Carboxypeptidase regulatory-like domain
MSLLIAATLIAMTVGVSMIAETATFVPAGPINLTEITGRILDIHGQPVAALKISLRDWFGSDLGSAVTDVNGVYDLRKITPGRYHCNFRPLAENSNGETVIIIVPSHSMRLNLTLNRNPPAIASTYSFTTFIA